MEQTNAVYTYLIDNELFTEKELELITNINGYSIDTLNACIYARFGYHSLEQLQEEEN
jgi:hypothetical protein